MNKGRFFQWTTVILIVLNLVILGFVLKKGRGHHERGPMTRTDHPKGSIRGEIVDRLGFNEAQTAEYDLLIDSHKKAIAEADHGIRKAKKALFGLLKSSDQSNKEALIANINTHQKSIEEAHFEHFESIRGICTEDQMERFDALTEDLARLFAPHGDRPPPNQ
jgi:periplasmic protein CpxP/Spy